MTEAEALIVDLLGNIFAILLTLIIQLVLWFFIEDVIFLTIGILIINLYSFWRNHKRWIKLRDKLMSDD